MNSFSSFNEDFSVKIAFLMGRLAKYDAIGNFTFDVMKELSKYHILSLYAFAIDRKIPFITSKFITRKHDHNFLEEFKAIINPVNLAKDLSKNDVIIAIAPQANDILSIPLISKLVNPKQILILDFHGVTPPIYHKSLRRKFIEYYRILTVKLLGKISDFIIVHSNFLKKELIENFDLKSNVLPIGVDNRKFSS